MSALKKIRNNPRQHLTTLIRREAAFVSGTGQQGCIVSESGIYNGSKGIKKKKSC